LSYTVTTAETNEKDFMRLRITDGQSNTVFVYLRNREWSVQLKESVPQLYETASGTMKRKCGKCHLSLGFQCVEMKATAEAQYAVCSKISFASSMAPVSLRRNVEKCRLKYIDKDIRF
jgi:hypothetical protein